MNIQIRENTLNLHNRTRFFNDVHLKMLVDVCISNCDVPGLIMFVRYMFYSFSVEEYNEQLSLINVYYSRSMEEITVIYNIFSEWKPYEKYNMGELRGAFLELLVYNLLKIVYNYEKIYSESQIIIGDFTSYTLDFIIPLKKILNVYECKFSFESFKRSHLNQIISIINKLDNCKAYIVFFQTHKKLFGLLTRIQEDTSDEKLDIMMKKLNIITLEDFIEDNPFKSDKE